jgi:hypothetical protein
MTAADIAAALGEARKEGPNWRCRCPLCGRNTLSLRDNPTGRVALLIKTWCGCATQAVRQELDERKLLNGKGPAPAPSPGEDDAANDPRLEIKIDNALEFWRSNTMPLAGSPGEVYLASRLLLQRPMSATLRYTTSVYHPTEQRTFPAIIALLQHEKRGAVAIHAICLNPLDASSKLTIQDRKFSLGPVKGAAVRLFPAGPELGVGEGVETCLAFQQATGIAVWATLGAGLANFEPPPVDAVSSLILIEDQDDPGRKAVAQAALRFSGLGYRVRIARPLIGKDVNDALLAIGLGQPLCAIDDYQPIPNIKVVPGERHLAADCGLEALIEAKVPFYQRNIAIIRIAATKAKNAAGEVFEVPSIVPVSPAILERALGQSATWMRADRRTKRDQVIDPPSPVVAQILDMVGEWPFGPLTGIIQCPTLRRDGSLLDQGGYDEPTGLVLINSVKMPPVAAEPTRDDAEKAFRLLDGLLVDFPFVDQQSRAVAQSMTMTPVLRGAMEVAPMHLATAPRPGTGKSYLADCASMIATGERCAVKAQSRNPDETEKRLIGSALEGRPIIALDNCRHTLEGDFLCQVIAGPLLSVRALGRSDQYRITNTFTMFCNGNNAVVADEMVRRTIRCAMDANREDPEKRTFTSAPLDLIRADRGRYLHACLTLARAYVIAGMPMQLPPLPSFETWSVLVREPLLWLGGADPLDTMEALRAEDPAAADRYQVFDAWKSQGALGFGKNRAAYTSEIIDVAVRFEPLREALAAVASPRTGTGIDPKALGKWLSANEKNIAAGCKLLVDRGDRSRPRWYLEPIAR